jgi:CelD/BcsL family acetyltransferase involved in cellulose biosynthesis
MSASVATSRFYSAVARWSADNGWLRLAFLRVGGAAVAFDFSLEHRRRHYLLKTGYDEALRALGPGKLLREDMLRRTFEHGLASYEMLGDFDDWKGEWATRSRSRHEAQVFANGGIGRALMMVETVAKPVARRAHARWFPGSR